MAKDVCVRMNAVLAASAIAAFVVVSICGTGTALAADRMVLCEQFTGTW